MSKWTKSDGWALRVVWPASEGDGEGRAAGRAHTDIGGEWMSVFSVSGDAGGSTQKRTLHALHVTAVLNADARVFLLNAE